MQGAKLLEKQESTSLFSFQCLSFLARAPFSLFGVAVVNLSKAFLLMITFYCIIIVEKLNAESFFNLSLFLSPSLSIWPLPLFTPELGNNSESPEIEFGVRKLSFDLLSSNLFGEFCCILIN